jgi:hypothetical protein
MDRFNAIGIDDYANLTTAELADRIRDRAQPCGYMAAFGGTIGVLDAMIHQQDIRRPLSLPRTTPRERLRAALQLSLYVAVRAGSTRLASTPFRCKARELVEMTTQTNVDRGMTTTVP